MTVNTKKPKRTRPARKPKLSRTLGFCLVALTPIMLLYFFLRFLPIIQTFVLSFLNYNGLASSGSWAGLENFRRLFRSDIFLRSLRDTTIIAFAVLLITLPLSLVVANLIQRKARLKGWFESAYFVPVIIPMVPAVIAWKELLASGQSGLVNHWLSFFGVEPVAWLIRPQLALLTIIIITVWKNIGYNMLIFAVGLTGISEEYYEAASIDGATGFAAFRYITIPLLKPVTIFVSIMTLIKGYNVFSTAYILASDTQGSPGYVVRVLIYDIYENISRYYKFGYASAEAVILFLIVLVLTIIQFELNKERKPRSRFAGRGGNV